MLQSDTPLERSRRPAPLFPERAGDRGQSWEHSHLPSRLPGLPVPPAMLGTALVGDRLVHGTFVDRKAL